MQKTQNPRIIANWFLESLGIITRDVHGDDYTELLLMFVQRSQSDKKKPIRVEEIEKQLGLKRSTAYKYVGRLMDAGILRKIGMNRYVLADGQLTRIVDDIKRDVLKILEKIRERAELLDKKLDYI
jgi:predicted transcriptional regulator